MTEEYMNQMISVELLQVADSYQRTIRKNIVKKIKKNFDPASCGSLCIGQRADGTYWVVDGQQRLQAMKELGFALVRCDVFESSGSAHEARVFLHKNRDRMGISQYHIFKASVEEGNEVAIAMLATIEHCGFKLSASDSSWPHIRCVNTLHDAYDMGGLQLIRDVLDVITDCWLGEDSALQGVIVGGLATFLHKYQHVDKRRLGKKLSSKNPKAIARAGDSYSMSRGGRAEAITNVICELYNKGLRSGRLIER
jgi:hypothetical protein